MHASLCETFGLVVLEAQASGTPAVVFRGSGMDDITFGGPDFLAEEQNPESLAKAILRSYQNNLRNIGLQVREAVLQHYPWKTVFKGLFELYTELQQKENTRKFQLPEGIGRP